MDLGHRIKELRLSLDMTQEELAQKTGFQTKGAISRIESGLRDLNQNQIMKFAEVLSTTPTYLMGWDKEKASANAIPLIGTIAAGMPILAEQNIEDYFNIDSSIKCDFCLKVQGDSMVDEGIKSGDIVFIKQQADVENGEIGAVIVGTEATLKRIYKSSASLILQPANAKYEPIILDSGDVIIAGKLVAVLNMR